jgi:hypothetical protein
LISPINNLVFSYDNNNNFYDKIKRKNKNIFNLYNFPFRKNYSSNLDNMKFKLKYKDVLLKIQGSPKKKIKNPFNEINKRNPKKENNIYSINSPINTSSKYYSFFSSMPQKNNKKVHKVNDNNYNKDNLKRDLFKKYLNINMKEASKILKGIDNN